MDKELNDLFFLFHGIEGTRRIQKNTWLKANKKRVKDGGAGTIYLSGFHIFSSKEEAYTYLTTAFRTGPIGSLNSPRHRAIVKVNCKNLRKKEHSRSNVYLADKIKFI